MNVGELTLDVGETTSYVGELVVGELTRWRNDRHSTEEQKQDAWYKGSLESICKAYDKLRIHLDNRESN